MITAEELLTAARQIKNKTAPGLDGVTNEALKIIVDARPEILLQLYNRCLTEGLFPNKWKRVRLVLIKKRDRPPNKPSSYRPLCLLDSIGKLFEKIIDNRLRNVLKDGKENGLSENQFGFRKGRSTIHAIEQVVQFANESGGRAESGTGHTRHLKCFQRGTMGQNNGSNASQRPPVLPMPARE